MSPSATSSAIEDEIITLETAYWDSMKDNDVEASLTLTYDPCVVSGAQGAAQFDHEAMRKMSEHKTWKLNDYTIDNMIVQTVGQNVVVTGYGIKLDMQVEGKATTMNCAETSTWVKADGRWQCVQHSESPIGDPFGRQSDANQKSAK